RHQHADPHQAHDRARRYGRAPPRGLHPTLRPGAHLLGERGAGAAPPGAWRAMSGPEHRATLEIVNKLGLHARAAALLVQTATRFECEVTASKDGQVANGKSIMGVMMLAAEQGSQIEVVTSGPQASDALEAIRTLVAARFNEES